MSAEAWLEELRAGQRRALARALSLAESELPEHRQQLDALWHAAGNAETSALRIAFTGPPGAGKSSLIERVGSDLVRCGARLAVLPIDPSSHVSGGSLLADQTRMTELSRHPAVFIRPSAAGTTLGGLAAHTQESIALCELAGYDWVILETVGVGQNEVDVAALADVVLLVLTADAGDELQALKRGVNEITHALIVNKAENERREAATALGRAYVEAAHLSRAEPLPLFITSAQNGSGVDELVTWLKQQRAVALASSERRQQQRLSQFERSLESPLLGAVLKHPELQRVHAQLRAELAAGSTSACLAIARFVAELERVLGVRG